MHGTFICFLLQLHCITLIRKYSALTLWFSCLHPNGKKRKLNDDHNNHHVINYSDTTSEITSLDQIQGDWWILKGQNCGQDELWNGGYDAYPCQLESYVQLGDDGEKGGWVRNTTYCFGQDDTCTSVSINIAPAATIEAPGVVRTTYDNPLYMQMEER